MTEPALRTELCWRTIGVEGDQSCPELATYVHCRNCPVFAGAGHDLFDREPPPGYQAEWIARLAQPPANDASDERPLLVFRMGQEWLALEVSLIDEIAETRPVHRIPHVRHAAVRGLVNIRGRLHLCAALEQLLQIDPTSAQSAAPDESRRVQERMIVIGRGEQRWVFSVADVDGVVRAPRGKICAAPSTVSVSPTSIAAGIYDDDSRKIGVLDSNRLIDALERCLA